MSCWIQSVRDEFIGSKAKQSHDSSGCSSFNVRISERMLETLFTLRNLKTWELALIFSGERRASIMFLGVCYLQLHRR